MSRTKKTLIIAAAIIVCFLGFVIGQIVFISMPTSGNQIEQYENPGQALLVIDIQEDFTGTTAKPPFPYKDSEKLIQSVNTIIDSLSGKNIHIIYIRQELDGFLWKMLSNLFAGGNAIKGNPGTEVDKRVSIVNDHIFPKPKSDSFSNPEIEKFLIEHQVNELYLVGLDAGGCVHVTAQGALNRGYTVNIITDAIVLLKEEKWEELLVKYQQEGINLMQSQEFMNKSF